MDTGFWMQNARQRSMREFESDGFYLAVVEQADH